MALSTKMEMRQGQSLVMTPQLLQAIKLLQFSHLELQAFVENELERNPLLERDERDEQREPISGEASDSQSDGDSGGDEGFEDGGDWAGEAMPESREAIEGRLDTSFENVFQEDRSAPPAAEASSGDMLPVMHGAGAGGSGGGARFDDGETPDFESNLTRDISLRDHLESQLELSPVSATDRMIGRFIIDAIDDNGYLSEAVEDIAERLGIDRVRVEAVLAEVQRFDPSGVGARDIAECLAIQLREKDRFDPAMAAMVANLPLVAKRDMAGLKRACGVDDEDLLDMIAEIRELDPKPGRGFGSSATEVVVPDVIIRAAPDGSWLIDLNPDTLPRVLVNQTYHARISSAARTQQDKVFLAECLQNASWLTRSLEQRARTILKVASEIVRQQDGFFAHGIEHLRPLNLKAIADAIGMHESTVSRVTSNKYLVCPRGVFEMKYFFSASIPATGHGEAHSAEAVRFKIKHLIDAEPAEDVLSDDAIVTRLKESGVDIARRTVAKYRESLRIPSSMDRRRLKREGRLVQA
ncbi:MAG: RNA polymerase factor sigma-54 [Bosea sp. (in: a-proteobacteria)]